MKLLYKEQPRTLVVSSKTFSLTFRTNEKQTQLAKPTVNLDLVPNESIARDDRFKPLLKRDVSGCLGLIYVENQIFLAVITRATKNVASPIFGESVDKIDLVDFVSLNNNEWDFIELDGQGYPLVGPEEMQEDRLDRVQQHPCFEFKKLLSNGSFYYSNDFDLTSALQSRGAEEKVNTLSHYQPQYMWNSFLIDDMIRFRSNLDKHNQLILDDNKFLTTVIRGFAKTVYTRDGEDSFTIISKQSWKRAGTRYNTRGIDDNGNVANFVESEFIYNNPSHSSIYTYTQIRGSVPTFWEQDSSLMNPKITLTRSLEATQPVFNKHFAEIGEHYGVCHIIDLLSKTKSSEVQVSKRYRQLYEHCDRREEIEYTDFDFHSETKVGGFSAATKILRSIQESLYQFGFFTFDMNSGQVVTRQDGVFRINCLDCLDRTNLIEQVISRTVLDIILKGQYAGSARDAAHIEYLKQLHNSLWADNGDAISQIYTGTNALKSSFSRSGKMNLAGALSDVSKSVSRMYQNTFVDGKKQSTIDLLLGVAGPSRKVKIYDPASEYVTAELKKQRHVFSTSDKIKIFTGSYNVNALEPNTNRLDLTSWLFPPENDSMSDIVAIGLLEMIELNAGSILSGDASKPAKWAALLNEQLNSQREQYVLLRTESMTSMSLFLFVKRSKVHHVTSVSGSYKKTGLGGIAANKGACAVRFDYGATSFAFVTSHLAAGASAVMERFNDYSTILSGLVFTRNYSIKDHDHVIWFGDLNYRLQLPNYQCRDFIQSGAFDELMQYDQLTEERHKRGAFQEFTEGVIKFYPTYKFDKGTSDYDTSEKQRVPSWTDRILYLSDKSLKNDLQQLNYNSVMDMFMSDHKPVYATFEAKVEFIDREKKSEIARGFYEAYRKEHRNVSDLVSLRSISPTPSTSTSSKSESSFAVDALNDLNLLDDFDSNAPDLPSRPNPNSTAPNRVPPPPASRKTTSTELKLKQPRTLPPPPKSYITPNNNNHNNKYTDNDENGDSTKTPPRRLPPPFNSTSTPEFSSPKPPPPRKVMTASPAPMRVPIGFLASPLIPTSRSNSNTPTANQSTVSSPAQTAAPAPAPAASATVPPPIRKAGSYDSSRPMIPSKPASLSSSKVPKENDEDLTPVSSKEPPAPPAPRNNNMRNMSDWKPLVPK
ncbi:uncharacterized protein LODBEIA_P60490 [Lodderomyces beijingensis]|uniref:phosphoinositide 5-phosphatase n=1 Tax=Lodderomyces beijingensis TaxID=1775926 RepID=A0ABP0ZW35_9ASCO